MIQKKCREQDMAMNEKPILSHDGQPGLQWLQNVSHDLKLGNSIIHTVPSYRKSSQICFAIYLTMEFVKLSACENFVYDQF